MEKNVTYPLSSACNVYAAKMKNGKIYNCEKTPKRFAAIQSIQSTQWHGANSGGTFMMGR